jgi:hypothetical protein
MQRGFKMGGQDSQGEGVNKWKWEQMDKKWHLSEVVYHQDGKWERERANSCFQESNVISWKEVELCEECSFKLLVAAHKTAVSQARWS